MRWLTGTFIVPSRDGSSPNIYCRIATSTRCDHAALSGARAPRPRAWTATQFGAHIAFMRPTAPGESLFYTLPTITATLTQHAVFVSDESSGPDQVAELLELNQTGDLGVKALTSTRPVTTWRHRRQQSGNAASGDPAASHEMGTVLRQPALSGDHRGLHLPHASGRRPQISATLSGRWPPCNVSHVLSWRIVASNPNSYA